MTSQETVLFVLAIASPVVTFGVGLGMLKQQGKDCAERMEKHDADFIRVWEAVETGAKERSTLTERVAAHERAIVRADTQREQLMGDVNTLRVAVAEFRGAHEQQFLASKEWQERNGRMLENIRSQLAHIATGGVAGYLKGGSSE